MLIPTYVKRFMDSKKKLLVTAKCGSLEFSEIAEPYIPSIEKDQARSCAESITEQIIESGYEELLDAFQLQKPQVIEEEDKRA